MNGQGLACSAAYDPKRENEMRQRNGETSVAVPSMTVGNTIDRLYAAVTDMEASMERMDNMIVRPRPEKDCCMANELCAQPTIPEALDGIASRVRGVQDRMDRLGKIVANQFDGGWKLE